MKKILFLSFLGLLILSGAVCKTTPKELVEATKPVQLVYWRVFDDSDAFGDLIAEYNSLHPNVNIVYKKLRYEEFEKTLLDALAEDRGPDMFSIQNTWMRGYQSKLLPLPATLSVPYRTIEGTIKKEAVWKLNTIKGLALKDLRNLFIDQVEQDVYLPQTTNTGIEYSIYGLPLSIDTMVLFYNKELLNASGIPNPATDWQTFKEHVKKLTRQDSAGNITTAGAALGSATNINRSSDILSLLMMQNGAEMINTNGRATYNTVPAGLEGRSITPGEEALIFYTDYASPQKEVYTWNEDMPDSLDAFIQGKTAYYFGYSYDIPTIQSRAPKLQYGITTMPQIQGNKEVNFANYWIEVVSRKTQHSDIAWDFLQFITSKPENAIKYLNRTSKPTALRSLIQTQQEDIVLEPFAKQLLTAKSWYKGKDAMTTEKIFQDMILDVLTGNRIPKDALDISVRKVDQTL